MQKPVMQQPNNPSIVNLESIEVMERDTPEIVKGELLREVINQDQDTPKIVEEELAREKDI